MWTNIMRVDLKLIMAVLAIQICGLITISSFSKDLLLDNEVQPIFHPLVMSQIKWIVGGWLCFFFIASLDYTKLRHWVIFFYVMSCLALCGLFLTHHIAGVQRWYRIGGFHIQPSELAKLSVVLTMSWFLEYKAYGLDRLTTVFGLLVIAGVPFLLIVKQPDLGTAMVLYPMTVVVAYFGGIRPWVVKMLCIPGALISIVVALTFSGVVPYESLKSSLCVLKEYQYERLNPDTHHQRASQTAIALGGYRGSGWRQGDFWRGGSLPASYTDSIFSAFGEEFGLYGLVILLSLYYTVIVCCFKSVAVAKDTFGRLISAGIAIYLAMHVLVNIGMMSGCLPITGVPLVLMSYGGSSMIATMTALGIAQSVYSRRFMF